MGSTWVLWLRVLTGLPSSYLEAHGFDLGTVTANANRVFVGLMISLTQAMILPSHSISLSVHHFINNFSILYILTEADDITSLVYKESVDTSISEII